MSVTTENDKTTVESKMIKSEEEPSVITSSNVSVDYFNNIWNQTLLQNPTDASQIFNFNILPENNNREIYINSNNSSNTDNDEHNYANMLQSYYNYIPKKERSNTLLSASSLPANSQKINSLTLLFSIFLLLIIFFLLFC